MGGIHANGMMGNVPFMLAVAVIGILLLVFLFKIIAWVFKGLLNIGFLLVAVALAVVSFFGLKTGNQNVLMVGFGGLIIVSLVALGLRKRPQ